MDLISGAIAPDVARAALCFQKGRMAKLASKVHSDGMTVEASATAQALYTRQLDISTLSDEQLDALEAALRATVARLEAPDPTIKHEE